MAEQLTFNLPVRASLTRGDFFVSEANALAVARLENVGDWPLAKMVLIAPERAGKTHLAHVWAEANSAAFLKPADLGTLDVGAVATAVVVDDADQLSKDEEVQLFHLHNHLASNRLPLLLTAQEGPARWKTSLPDLKSRLEATDTVKIGPPDDALLSAMLVKLFTDRQLSVDPNLIPWLSSRMERSFSGAQALVEVLDKTALAAKRRINRGLAATVLDKLSEDHT